MKKLLVWTAAAAGLAAGMPAQALVSSWVSVGEPAIEVLDLKPDDGIPAVWGEDPSPWATLFRHRFYFALREALPPPETEGDGQFSLETGALGGWASAPSSYYYVGDDLYPATGLRITPYTRVTVSVPYRLDIQLSPEQPVGGEAPRAHASLELVMLGLNNLRTDPDTDEPLADEMPFQRSFIELMSSFGAPVIGKDSREGVLSVNFDNDSATDATFGFRAELVAFGSTGTVAAVPEPGTWALWLAGAGLLVWRARRRRDA